MSTGLLGFESVQERQGGVREYLSPSRLNCWLSCPLEVETSLLGWYPHADDARVVRGQGRACGT